jgi:hypothetical protein
MYKYPNTRYGWHLHYVRQYNKNPNEQLAMMAMAYLLLHLAFDALESEHADSN